VAIQSRTRKELRQEIGRNLGAMMTGKATSGSTTTLIDTQSLLGGDDDYNGKFVRLTSGNANGETGIISDFVNSSNTATIKPIEGTAFSGAIADNDYYELWDEEYNPDTIDAFINDVIVQYSPRALITEEDTTLFGHISRPEHSIPTNMVAISEVYYRTSFDSETLDDANNNDWTAGSAVTVSKDSTDYRGGGASLNLVTVDVGSQALATKTIGSKDISNMDKVEFWIKSKNALSANSLTLTVGSALNIPALSANTWTKVQISLSAPQSLTAVTSLVISSAHATENDNNEIWINRIIAVETATEKYEKLPPYVWRADRENSKFRFIEGGASLVNDAKIKLVGYKLPSELSADTSNCEINPTLIVAKATSRALISQAGGRTTDLDERRQLSQWWESQAILAERSLPILRPGTKMVGTVG
tara:strand:- start:1073 stop:2326 length:1254 start_codon:yes stop_codon:yes gene_type:complete